MLEATFLLNLQTIDAYFTELLKLAVDTYIFVSDFMSFITMG